MQRKVKPRNKDSQALASRRGSFRGVHNNKEAYQMGLRRNPKHKTDWMNIDPDDLDEDDDTEDDAT